VLAGLGMKLAADRNGITIAEVLVHGSAGTSM
jgi:hypothetical protein